MSTDLEKYKEIYVNDMREHLQNLNNCLVDIEHEKDNMELINEIFRCAHTIKGNSATMEYHDVATVAHRMENLLDKIRTGKMVIDQEIMEVLFAGSDMIVSMIESIANGTDTADSKDILKRLDRIANSPPTETANKSKSDCNSKLDRDTSNKIKDAILSGKNVYSLAVSIDLNCSLKSARAIILIRNLCKISEKITVIPSEDEITKSNPSEFQVILASDFEADILQKTAMDISDISNVEITQYKEEIGSDTAEQPEIVDDAADAQKNHEKISNESPVTIQNIRVDIHQLDSFMNLIGELVINKIGMEHILSNYKIPEINEYMGYLDRIMDDLQAEVMALRMVPVDQLFNKYPRIIRDIAKSQGKSVKLVIEGGDIELDRTVLDGINDPMIHLLRNAIDHGIETPQQRYKSGKPKEGIIQLKAKREKNHVIIEVSDDGAGIIPEVIKKTAISRGLINTEDSKTMTDEELISLLFLPGFSTAKTLTDISGRGVGLDVVKRDIERLGGSVKIYSVPGQGSRFELRLPLTLAIIKAFVVRVGGQRYVLPLSNVIETIKITPDLIKMINKNETCILRGHVIPLVRLNRLFAIKSAENIQFAIVVEHNSQLVGIVIDELLGQQEVVIKSLGPSLEHFQGFAGATIIKDGRVALILDVNSLLN